MSKFTIFGQEATIKAFGGAAREDFIEAFLTNVEARIQDNTIHTMKAGDEANVLIARGVQGEYNGGPTYRTYLLNITPDGEYQEVAVGGHLVYKSFFEPDEGYELNDGFVKFKSYTYEKGARKGKTVLKVVPRRKRVAYPVKADLDE